MKSNSEKKLSAQRGQVVVEYVLLLTISISLAMVIVTVLIRRGDPTDPENSGALIQQWHLLQQAIGQDNQN